jgi:hypothetical protein
MKLKTVKGLEGNIEMLQTGELHLSEVGRHPLLQPSQIQGILSNFNNYANSYPLASVMPLKERNTDVVEMDVDLVIRGGMTPMVAQDSSTPIYGAHGQARRKFEAAEFREKVRLVQSDLYNFRKIGTEADLLQARELLRLRYEPVQERLTNRLEWMRRSVLFFNKVEASVHNGPPFELTYKHPAYMRPALVGNDRWDQYGTSDPIGNLQLWVEEFVLHTGYMVEKVVAPVGMLRHLSNNERFREMATHSYGAFNGGRDAVSQNIRDLTGIGNIEEWNSSLSFYVNLTADASAGQAVVNLRTTDELEAGDVITFVKLGTEERVRGVVASISGNAVTLTANLPIALHAGDSARYAKMTIPRNRILILGTPSGGLTTVGSLATPDADLVKNWAEVTTTLSRWENFDNPRTGVFSQLRDLMHDDPPALEQLIGIRALPNVFYHEAWMSPTVL